MIRRFDDLVAALRESGRATAVAVVEAQDEHTIDAIVQAAHNDLIHPILIGRERDIRSLIGERGDVKNVTVIGTGNADESLRAAASLIEEGRAGAIMKGKLETGDFMKGVLNKEYRLVQGGRLSLVGFYEMPQYHKLFAVSDVGLNTYPDLSLKKDILLNAVKVLRALGVEKPKVAVLSAVEKMNPKMPDSVDADALKQMNLRGEIGGCLVEGPISFDLAMFREAARIKDYRSEVAGDADLLVMPDIVSGNVLVKCLTGFAGAVTAGTVVGARVPVILTSRSAEASDKYYSIALAAYAASYFGEGQA
ncbi:MAG: bifunctional enoyl-CoA hydratase/phosphate acetyltransferase [Treponema sp.]|jgi:phosphotransacetylase|nr:bifunctional enoyl-CoA hydratase/phosphate acetyltransferase [Treponema sp.]